MHDFESMDFEKRFDFGKELNITQSGSKKINDMTN